MREFIDFLTQHWQLAAVFLLILAAYIGFEFMQGTGAKEVSPEQAVDLYNHRHALVWDVRTKQEFNEGHIIGAKNIEMAEILADTAKLQKYADKPVILVCASGKRSMQCLKHLETHGFVDVVNLSGGMHAWQAAGLPITKD